VYSISVSEVGQTGLVVCVCVCVCVCMCVCVCTHLKQIGQTVLTAGCATVTKPVSKLFIGL
jgi:hypothetical protein